MRAVQIRKAASFFGHFPSTIPRQFSRSISHQVRSHSQTFSIPKSFNHKGVTMEDLTSSLKTLGLSSVPQLEKIATFPIYNQVDIYRSHIAELLAPITGVAAEQIYPLLQWTQVLEYGDLMLPVPALRIKGKKPDALAVEIKDKVMPSFYSLPTRDTDMKCSSPSHPSSSLPSPKRPLSVSSSSPTLLPSLSFLQSSRTPPSTVSTPTSVSRTPRIPARRERR